MDKFPIKSVIVVFGCIMLVGQTIFVISTIERSFAGMLIGRVAFGIPSQAYDVAQSAITAVYFPGDAFAFMLAIVSSFDDIATALNDHLSPYLVIHYGMPTALWSGVVTVAISFSAGIMLLFMTNISSSNPLGHLKSNNRNFQWSSVLNLPRSFWLIFAVNSLIMASMITFFNISADLFYSKWYHDTQAAALPKAVNQWVTVLFKLAVGWYVDRYNQKMLLSYLSILCLIATYSLLYWSSISPFLGMTLFGIGWGMFRSALTAIVPFIIPEDMVGTAFGLLMCGFNAAMVLFPIVISQIKVQADEQDFGPVVYFCITISALCFILLVFLSFERDIIMESKPRQVRLSDDESPTSTPNKCTMDPDQTIAVLPNDIERE